jgi:hypothetical protein
MESYKIIIIIILTTTNIMDINLLTKAIENYDQNNDQDYEKRKNENKFIKICNRYIMLDGRDEVPDLEIERKATNEELQLINNKSKDIDLFWIQNDKNNRRYIMYDPDTEMFYYTYYLPCSWCGHFTSPAERRWSLCGVYCGCAETPREYDY